MSYHAEQRYINKRNDSVKENKLRIDADYLPSRHRNWTAFKKSFWDVNHFNFSFMKHTIHVDLRYAFDHFNKNTYNQNRSHFNATLLPTLIDPVLVTKSKHEGVDSLVFYKPFKTQEDSYHMLTFNAVLNDGKYQFKTIYDASSLQKVKGVIKATDGNTIYFKYGRII